MNKEKINIKSVRRFYDQFSDVEIISGIRRDDDGKYWFSSRVASGMDDRFPEGHWNKLPLNDIG